MFLIGEEEVRAASIRQADSLRRATSDEYPGPGSNRHGFPLVFETNASTNSATWAFAFGNITAEKACKITAFF